MGIVDAMINELNRVAINEASKPAEEINVSYLKSVLEEIHEDCLSQTEKERLQQLFQEILSIIRQKDG